MSGKTKIISAATHADELYLLLGRESTRWVARLRDDGELETIRSVTNAGKLFGVIESGELGLCALLTHDFDCTITRFPMAGGRGRKVVTEIEGRPGYITASETVGDAFYLSHYRGFVQRFDGSTLSDITGHLETGRDNLGASAICQGWDGAPVLGAKSGIHHLRDGLWTQVASGSHFRAMAFDHSRDELLLVGRSLRRIHRDGSETKTALRGELWAAALCGDSVYGHGFRHGVARVDRDGTSTPLGLAEVPISRNECLVTHNDTVHFIGATEVYRLARSDWDALADVSQIAGPD